MNKLAEIKMLYEAKVKETVPAPIFDPRDTFRVNSDKYLYRVLEHCQNNVQQAADMLFSLMLWRKTQEINEVTENTVDMDILKQGIYFAHGRDIDSCLLFIMNSKVYIKGQKDVEAVKKVFIYWLERLEREEGGKKVTLFFDMSGCGINNMNITLFSYMINVLKCYYPSFINYIIIFEMPWILSAGFKIIKEMLPAPAVERLRIVNKEKLKELVAPEQALVSWGGKDEYKFSFIPEKPLAAALSEDDDYSPGEMLKLKPSKLLTFDIMGNKIKANLIITNMDDSLVAFKIRTTAPEKFWVRPNSGILPKRVSQNIEISLQSGFQIDSVDKDRYLIVAVHVPKLNMSNSELTQIWKTSGSNMDEYRLCCAKLARKDAVDSNFNVVDPVNVLAEKMNKDSKKINERLDLINKYQIITLLFMIVTGLISIMILLNVGKTCSPYSV